MCLIKHSELRNQSPSVNIIPAHDVNEMIYGCCASIVVENETSSCLLGVLKTISSSNVVIVPSFCSVLKLCAH